MMSIFHIASLTINSKEANITEINDTLRVIIPIYSNIETPMIN